MSDMNKSSSRSMDRRKSVLFDQALVDSLPHVELLDGKGHGAEPVRRAYIETYGCQMNVSDSEIVCSILRQAGYDLTERLEEADVILLNSCAIRDKAEQSIRRRLQQLRPLKRGKPHLLFALLGCMAERLKDQLLEQEKLVDIVVGPDAYRSLPQLIKAGEAGQRSVNTLLSREETYADLAPVRLHTNGVSAFISIMRGCDNICSFCVVPFTRGRERSRDPLSIVSEAEALFSEGYREVTLLGQNVDSYSWSTEAPNKSAQRGLSSSQKVNFAELLARVADVDPALRVRFSTSNPRDMTDELLYTIKAHDNICNYIHLPVQSGSSTVLDRMRRGYDRETYLSRIDSIRRILGPSCGISTDIIAGFCDETESEHQETLSLMKEVRYDLAYMFMYSERPKTLAARKYMDNVAIEVKKRRLQEIIEIQRAHSLERHQLLSQTTHQVLIEGPSKRSADQLQGRNSEGKVFVFPAQGLSAGTYTWVKVLDCTAATLIAELSSSAHAVCA